MKIGILRFCIKGWLEFLTFICMISNDIVAEYENHRNNRNAKTGVA